MTIRQAHSLKVGLCGICGKIHIVLFDEGGDPFAEAIVPKDVMPGVMADMNAAAASAALERDYSHPAG